MRKYLALAALVSALATAACDGAGSGAIVGPEDAAPAYLLPPIDEGGGGDCCGGGGGETGGGTYTPPPAPQFRISADLYPIPSDDVKFRAWSRFEQLINGSWVKVNASTLAVSCSAPGVYDSDSETNAGFTDVEFVVGPYQNGAYFTISCYHQATYGGVTYTGNTSYSAQYIYL